MNTGTGRQQQHHNNIIAEIRLTKLQIYDYNDYDTPRQLGITKKCLCFWRGLNR